MQASMYICLATALSAVLLSSCSSVPQPATVSASAVPELPHSPLLLKASLPVPTEADIFALTAEQQAEFLNYFYAPQHSDMPANRRLYRFLARKVSGFDYLGKNHTASQAYALNSGNCMSLAVLTKALADLVDVDIEFQSIKSAPVFSIENDFLLSSDHVRTFLYDASARAPGKNMLQIGKPYLVIDYLPSITDVNGPRISQHTFIAMYYRNLAADAVLTQQYSQALALLKAALAYDPSYGAVVNLLAVVHRRLEQPMLAAAWYDYGLNVAQSKTSLLSNYAMLKLEQGEAAEADNMLQQLIVLNEQDPYIWYWYGKVAMREHRYADAVQHLTKAVQQAPLVHQLQLALAQAHYQNNNTAHAYYALQKAAELAAEPTEQRRYHAKLQALELKRRIKQQ